MQRDFLGLDPDMRKGGLHSNDIWCVIPVYNNASTIESIAMECSRFVPNVLVVDDGSTDIDIAGLFSGTPIKVISHKSNMGKGAAILSALAYIKEQNGRFLITIDADGQHVPEDLNKFLQVLNQGDDDFLLVGVRDFNNETIPGLSKFGRKFANFWFTIETGEMLSDCQSGFRAYPVRHLSKLDIRAKRYDFETEVLAKLAWGGVKIKTIDIKVWYPDNPEDRISHFRKVSDNLRISAVHTKLVLRRLLPIPHKKLIHRDFGQNAISLLLHPITLIKKLVKEHNSPQELSSAAATGVFLGALPLLFVHTIVIIYVTSRLHMNRLMAVLAQNICMPPVVPFLCIETGYFILNGKWLTELSFKVVVAELHFRLLEWALGSLMIGPILAFLVWICVFFIAKHFQKDRKIKTFG